MVFNPFDFLRRENLNCNFSDLDSALPPLISREERRRSLPDAFDNYDGQTAPRLPYCMSSFLKDAMDESGINIELNWISTGAESMVHNVGLSNKFVLKFIPGFTEAAFLILQKAQEGSIDLNDDLVDRLFYLSSKGVKDYDSRIWTDTSYYPNEILPDQFAFSFSKIGRDLLNDIGLQVPTPHAWAVLPHQSGLLEFYIYLQECVPEEHSSGMQNFKLNEATMARLRASPISLDLSFDKKNFLTTGQGNVIWYVDMVRRNPDIANEEFFSEAYKQCEISDFGFVPIEEMKVLMNSLSES